MIEILSRNEDDEHSGIFCPRLVRIDKKIEEYLPMLCAPTRIKRTPLLGIERRRCPTRCFEESHQFFLRNLFTRHRPRRPAIEQKRLDIMVCFSNITALDHLSRHNSR